MNEESGILSAQRPVVLDFCNLGVILRSVLALEAVLAVAALWGESALDGDVQVPDWVVMWAMGNALALPAVLLWILAMCGTQRLAGQRRTWVWYAWGGTLAALAGGVAAKMGGDWWPDAVRSSLPVAGCMAAAALAALAIVHGLVLQSRAAIPLAARARLAELQARIRPHFLFNALNSAVALAQDRPAQAQALLEDLSELFRAALSEAGHVTSLAIELELVRRYLAIEQTRFGEERMRVVWRIDLDALEARVPPLLLQPLAENAVRHGVEVSVAPVDIEITARREGRYVVLAICNTLSGEEQELNCRRNLGKKGQGLALSNVRERLALLHDWEASVESGWLGQSEPQSRCYRTMLRFPLEGRSQ